MASRPSTVGPSLQAEEARIRAALAAQLNEVEVTIESDKRTYVSMIGVLPPDRFREEKLKLFPDVYKVVVVRIQSVEIDLKVDATNLIQRLPSNAPKSNSCFIDFWPGSGAVNSFRRQEAAFQSNACFPYNRKSPLKFWFLFLYYSLLLFPFC